MSFLYTPRLINVPEPEIFLEKVSQTLSSIHELIHVLREKTMHSESDGCLRFLEESGPCAFQASSQYERPEEFLQTLLDVVRIIFEPYPEGTLGLNSNAGFILDEIGNQPFRLGYWSATSNPGESVVDLHERVVVPQMKAFGYADVAPKASFLMVTYGQLHSLDRNVIRTQLFEMYRPGMRLDELLSGLAEAVQHGHMTIETNTGRSYMGSSYDAALGVDRFRLSMWLFLPFRQNAELIH